MEKLEFDRNIAGVPTKWVIQFNPMGKEPFPSFQLYLPGVGDKANKLIPAAKLPKEYQDLWKQLSLGKSPRSITPLISKDLAPESTQDLTENLEKFDELAQRFREILKRFLSPPEEEPK